MEKGGEGGRLLWNLWARRLRLSLLNSRRFSLSESMEAELVGLEARLDLSSSPSWPRLL
jgi:hypothetical protein